VATVAAVAVIIAVIVGATLIELSSNGTVKSRLGAATFVAGRARDLAPQVARYGPLLFPDLAGKDRPIYLQHLGTDEKTGWVGVQALNPGEATDCVLKWEAPRFVDPCTGKSYDAAGDGLIRYPAPVLPSDRINLDLRHALPASGQ
jgi:hypothetical protein